MAAEPGVLDDDLWAEVPALLESRNRAPGHSS